jgi:hypothetical protein
MGNSLEKNRGDEKIECIKLVTKRTFVLRKLTESTF